MRLDFVGQSYNSRDDKAETINYYPEVNTDKRVAALIGTPGLTLLANLGATEFRGIHVPSKDDTKAYCVIGRRVVEVLNNSTFTDIGTLNTESGIVSMADNGIELVIVDGTSIGYVHTFGTTTLEHIPEPFPGGDTILFINGYFISVQPNSQVMWQSDLYDGRTWNALNIASAEGDPDNIETITSNHKELFVHGSLSSEVWYDAAFETGFSFTRMNGGILEYGIAAKRSVATIGGVIFLLAKTSKGERVVISITGYTPNIVSHPGINYQIGQMAKTSDAEAFTYMQEGHSFYVLTFPSADVTFVYDMSTQQWHRRKSYGIGRWRARCYGFFGGRHVVGDYSNGNLYEMSMDAVTENGEAIERVRVCREVIDMKEYNRIFVHELQLDMDLGLGNDQVDNPVAVLQWSKDNGKTYGSEHFKPLMKQGEYRRSIMWHRLGMARRRLFKLTITDPVKVCIRGAWIDAEKGES